MAVKEMLKKVLDSIKDFGNPAKEGDFELLKYSMLLSRHSSVDSLEVLLKDCGYYKLAGTLVVLSKGCTLKQVLPSQQDVTIVLSSDTEELSVIVTQHVVKLNRCAFVPA